MRHFGVAADFAFIVDDGAATFRNEEEDTQIVGIAIPRTGTGLIQHMGFDVAHGQNLGAGPPDRRGCDFVQLGAGFAIAAEHGKSDAEAIDGEVILAMIVQVAIAAQCQKGQAWGG